ncbi:alpha/beta family hydrolase [Pseudomonas oryzihabitans]|uniref:alpha/beta family hydrolase n=1 Tax=Pseudomonas oryzihabitans TaxID=47885 RepID=UPI00123BDEE1|nr:alpha/beta family hydrolase [Pseudomonas oryzihabitans]QEU02968.1 alpha/beta fold hydrolase [Pseudomonas oryzihabitans]
MADELYLDSFRECRPAGPPLATLLLAHGAGAGMDSPFMEQLAEALARRDIRTLRFDFPYMARARAEGRRRPPNPAPVLLEHWRAMVATWRAAESGPLWLAGKSMGGRMASLLADDLGATGLVCLGYPFHPASKPERLRTEHLATLATPTLIVQGERDALGTRTEVAGYALAPTLEVQWIATADHDLKPLKSSGLSQTQALVETAAWVAAFVRSSG